MIRLAKKASKKSNQKYKLGAAIVTNSRVLAVGYNTGKYSAKFGSGKYGKLHAEGSCIKNAIKSGHKDKLKGSTIFIYRRNSLLAWPCPDCLKLINKYEIGKIVST